MNSILCTVMEGKYQSMTPREHVLRRPGNYIGQMARHEGVREYVPDLHGAMDLRTLSYSPAFVKIFDEILTNAFDHSLKEKDVKNIKVVINVGEGCIEVYNDGPGIEIEKQRGGDVYIPEFIFGHVYTSSNYDDTQERECAGMNGIGAKATNIFSTKFVVETADGSKLYRQEFRDNMSNILPPAISKRKGKPYTRITFWPDFKRFGMESIDGDTEMAIRRRVYDASAVSRKGVTVHYNGAKLAVNSLLTYARGYPVNIVGSQDMGNNWEVILATNDVPEFSHVSFVNGIPTRNGGKHVEYISNQIVRKCKALLAAKYKDLEISSANIRNTLFLFVKGTVANPVFDSQTKEYLATPSSQFSQFINIPDALVAKYAKQVGDKLAELAKERTESKLNKKIDTRFKKTVKIPKLDDAYYAGTSKGRLCSLLLTEGDSAKTPVLAGISPKMREYIGVFPLRGKGLNVQRASASKADANTEITNIMKILGLQKGVKYSDVDSLRYGKVYICADADEDGKHIKGLFINFFRTWFPELLSLGYVHTIKTPIVKVIEKGRGKGNISFYNLQDYEAWASTAPFSFEAKYKKGLGSLTRQDAKECFGDLDSTQMKYVCDENALRSIDIPFSKDNKRKEWLSVYDRNDVVDYTQKEITISDFVHKELKHFSVYDNMRSIPHVIDGLKPSQRKILYACFKKNLIRGKNSAIRVSQLAAYVSEQAEYHHGETSLQDAIIGMAQNFVGTNNLNLLFPEDQFGSRRSANDASSPRYIHTCLEKYVSYLFPSDDFELLERVKGDEGDLLEPEYYVPVIPMVLVNGAKGIGSGYSTDVPQYNPRHLIDAIRAILTGNKHENLVPWYRGFKGKIVATASGFETVGVYALDKNKIIVTELPVKKWTDKYKEELDVLEDKGIVRSVKDKSTDKDVYFEITTSSVSESSNIEVLFGLRNKFSTNNMCLITGDGIKKFKTPEEILAYYCPYRLGLYEKRRLKTIDKYKDALDLIENRIKFIECYMDGRIALQKVPEKMIIKRLEELQLKTRNGSYNYLLHMNFISLSEEKLAALFAERENTENKLSSLYKETPKSMWLSDLEMLEKHV